MKQGDPVRSARSEPAQTRNLPTLQDNPFLSGTLSVSSDPPKDVLSSPLITLPHLQSSSKSQLFAEDQYYEDSFCSDDTSVIMPGDIMSIDIFDQLSDYCPKEITHSNSDDAIQLTRIKNELMSDRDQLLMERRKLEKEKGYLKEMYEMRQAVIDRLCEGQLNSKNIIDKIKKEINGMKNEAQAIQSELENLRQSLHVERNNDGENKEESDKFVAGVYKEGDAVRMRTDSFAIKTDLKIICKRLKMVEKEYEELIKEQQEKEPLTQILQEREHLLDQLKSAQNVNENNTQKMKNEKYLLKEKLYQFHILADEKGPTLQQDIRRLIEEQRRNSTDKYVNDHHQDCKSVIFDMPLMVSNGTQVDPTKEENQENLQKIVINKKKYLHFRP